MKRKDRTKQQKQSPAQPAIKVPDQPAAMPPELPTNPADSLSDIGAITEETMASHPRAGSAMVEEPPRPELQDDFLDKTLANIATNAWRAARRIVDSETGEPKEGMKLIHRDISAIRDALQQFGVETIDPAGRTYDSGLALKVVSFEPTPGLSKEEIKVTIKPSVGWQGRLIQMGEVIVGTPPSA